MKQRANIEIVTASWGVTVKKTDLAEALWPRLQKNVQRRMTYRTVAALPAGRVAQRALRVALETHRRQVALRVR
jgi:hypothetical protein